MNNLKRILLILFFLILVPIVTGAQAASLKFDKTTVTTTNGATFSIAVTVDPGSDSLSSTDIYVTYDSTFLKVNSVSAGTLFPTVTHDESTSGKVYIAGMVNDVSASVTTAGTVATITFQSLKDGSTSLAFDCSTSKIIKNDINASDVMVCSQNNSSAVTIGAGSNNSSSETSTTPTVPPDELPQSGVFDNVAQIAIPGMFLLLVGGIFRLLL